MQLHPMSHPTSPVVGRCALLALFAASLSAQSQWTTEQVMWPRAFHAMAHDPVANQVRVFGGAQASTQHAEAWAFDGSAWSRTQPPPGVPEEVGYDWRRARFVAVVNGNFVAEWDRANWTTGPQPNAFGGGRWLLAYDPARQVTTLVDSSFGSTDVHDWNGATWTQRAMTGAPPPWNANGRLEHDPRTGAILSLTAFPPGTPLQVWSCNGTTWQRIVTPVSPPSLEWFSTARDPVSGDLLVFGGYQSIQGTAVPGNDLWAFDGTTWRLVPTTTRPSARYAQSMVTDAVNGRVLLYGGASFAGNAVWHGDLWSWNGSAWTQIADAAAPRIGHLQSFPASVVFDRPRGQILAFPFDAQGTAQTFDGARWTTHACGAQCPSTPSYLAFDEVFGIPVAVAANGDFAWTGTSWAALPFASSRPTVRSSSALASTGQQLVMFGGLNGLNPTNETWTLDVGGWTRRFVATSPPPAAGHRMASMPSRGEVVLVTNNRTWTWNGIDWADRGAVPFPYVYDFAMAWSPERDRVVLHGGIDASQMTQQTLAKVWEWDGSVWLDKTPPASPARMQHRMVEGPGQLLYVMPSSPQPFHRLGSVALATSVAYGTGCAGSSGIPGISTEVWQRPRLGEAFVVEGSSLPSTFAFLILGFRDDQWAGQPLPLSLASVGMPGCSAWLEPFDVLGALPSGGAATWSLAVPNDPGLLGLDFHLQGVALDPVANAFGAVVSNGLRNRIGRR